MLTEAPSAFENYLHAEDTLPPLIPARSIPAIARMAAAQSAQ